MAGRAGANRARLDLSCSRWRADLLPGNYRGGPPAFITFTSRRTRWHRRFANNLLKVWPALWTFVTVEGVEPTNNPAERALRGPVIHRKLSHGTSSKDGERFAERALSAAVTCRLQGRSLFAYLRELITAHNRGDPFPALT
jgi:hypothetical protein